MFHVERKIKVSIFAKSATVIILLLIFLSCGIAKQRIAIPDYIILPEGKAILNSQNLNAFVFENNQKQMPFQQFVAAKYNDNNFEQRELVITIGKEKYRLIFYDNDEFEKYFGYSNFSALNIETASNKLGNQPKFIAISLTNALNEDCLQEGSLYFNIATQFLKNLKDEYLTN